MYGFRPVDCLYFKAIQRAEGIKKKVMKKDELINPPLFGD